MKVYQKPLKYLATTLLGALLLGVVFVTIGSSGPNTTPALAFGATGTVSVQPPAFASPGEAHALDPSPPSEVVKLIFIHHSCGEFWLADDGVRDLAGNLGIALRDNNYFVSDTSYGWGPADTDLGYESIGDHTDIGQWYNWFAGPHRDIYMGALYTESGQSGGFYSRLAADPGGENEIIMFKSCFPNSGLGGTPDDPPTSGDNPLRGQGCSSEHHTVGNAKGIYNDILEYFGTRQDKLFVVITAPPVQDDTYAANARVFNNWLVDDWLDGYPHHNVTVFDFYNVLTTNGGDADTNDYGWSTGNHHRVVTATTPITIEHITDGDDDDSPNVLEYPGWGSDNHPSSAGNHKATGEFVPLLNVYYNCWKHGDCWNGVADWISITAVDDEVHVYPGETATCTLSLSASAGLTAPVTLTLGGAPSEAMTSFEPNPLTPPGTSQLYVTTTASTLARIYTMVVTGTADRVTATMSLTLTVDPALTLVARPDVRVVLPGGIAPYTLSVIASGGFAVPVTLTLQGAPPATYASFGPNPVTLPGDSQLHITTTPSTAAGTYPMTVTGTADSFTGTTDLTLIVSSAALSFTLSVSPTIRIAGPNQMVSYTATVTGVSGFSQSVTLKVVGLPTDVGAGWSVNPVMPDGYSTLTLSVPGSPPYGEHFLRVFGIAEAQVVVEDIGLIINYLFRVYLPIVLK
jgi:hypothetical protein